jgi:phosphate transport system substrate-binding protein
MRLTMKKTLIAAAVTSLSVSFAIQAQARDYIAVVGSSTMFPFSTNVAENFGRKGTFKTPKIESTGTGGGIKLF